MWTSLGRIILPTTLEWSNTTGTLFCYYITCRNLLSGLVANVLSLSLTLWGRCGHLSTSLSFTHYLLENLQQRCKTGTTSQDLGFFETSRMSLAVVNTHSLQTSYTEPKSGCRAACLPAIGDYSLSLPLGNRTQMHKGCISQPQKTGSKILYLTSLPRTFISPANSTTGARPHPTQQPQVKDWWEVVCIWFSIQPAYRQFKG